MYTLGQVTFEDIPSANAAGPTSIITLPDSGGSSLPGLAIVAALAVVVWLALEAPLPAGRGRGGRGLGRFFGRVFGDAPKRRRKNPRRRRKNLMVWGG